MNNAFQFNSREEADKEFLKLAYEVASSESTDPSTQNGALLVLHTGNSSIILCSAANQFPRGVKELDGRWERPMKYDFVEHAERNLIYTAARLGIKTEGTTMYVGWFACANCARAIIQAGIKEVVGHDYPPHKEQTSWKSTIEVADVMLQEAGINFRRIPGHFGVKIRFNGKVVEA